MAELRGVKAKKVEVTQYTLEKPLLVNGQGFQGEFYIPIIDTEIPIVPSFNRGRKIVNLCGGVAARMTGHKMTRSPIIDAGSEEKVSKLAEYVNRHHAQLEETANATTRYGHLLSLEPVTNNADLYLNIGMFTADAAGHNMTEKAAQAIYNHLKKQFPSIRLVTIAGNIDSDKKPSKKTADEGRGRSVEAKLTIPETVLKKNLRTSIDEMVELYQKKLRTGSRLAGSLAENSNHANMAKGIYFATGQDVASIVEASLGKTIARRTDSGLYFAVKMPSLIVGTVGGGTSEQYARENLKELGCYGSGNPPGANADKLAQVIASATLCLELSLLAAMTNETELLDTHLRFER